MHHPQVFDLREVGMGESGCIDIAYECWVAKVKTIGIGDDVFYSCGRGGGDEIGVDGGGCGY
jgi:hypothetical protein